MCRHGFELKDSFYNGKESKQYGKEMKEQGRTRLTSYLVKG